MRTVCGKNRLFLMLSQEGIDFFSQPDNRRLLFVQRETVFRIERGFLTVCADGSVKQNQGLWEVYPSRGSFFDLPV